MLFKVNCNITVDLHNIPIHARSQEEARSELIRKFREQSLENILEDSACWEGEVRINDISCQIASATYLVSVYNLKFDPTQWDDVAPSDIPDTLLLRLNNVNINDTELIRREIENEIFYQFDCYVKSFDYKVLKGY